MRAYQREAATTAIYPGSGTPLGLYYASLGLAGEAGEVAGKVSKIIRDDMGTVTEERRAALVSELGDVLWYVAALADELDADLVMIADVNLRKLRRRADCGVLGGEGDER